MSQRPTSLTPTADFDEADELTGRAACFLFCCMATLLVLNAIAEVWFYTDHPALSSAYAIGLVFAIPACAAGLALSLPGAPARPSSQAFVIFVIGMGLLLMSERWTHRDFSPMAYLLPAFVFGAATLTNLPPSRLLPVGGLLLGLDIWRVVVSHGDGGVVPQTVAADGLCAVFGAAAHLRMWHLNRREKLHSRQALEDPLTELGNRRAFELRAEQALALARREQRPVTVAALDLDRFKQINDQHGHAAGDAVLRFVADALRRHARRPLDCLARLGGDEFAVLWFDLDLETAQQIGRRLVADIGQHPLRLDNGALVQPQISLGACAGLPAVSLGELLRLADTALYQAKGQALGPRSMVRSMPGTRVRALRDATGLPASTSARDICAREFASRS